ncbi:nucleoside hydrolase [Desulforhabdus amnigena]|uniref:Inosine/uridine-preferring nucleoside hydrolase domain-containing protein n=1 Tax=Desulforhabdus amnigena TaxID=40218 RepID=A0A9W6FV38_9BACT|nr:nucleoside hydrolase [Desulforhabdus amnigena]NLJ29412.1 hypothetical protein [Deltaproteobacteria bacterium]GLI35403.1 hypothetical protein DAMNIGENAA_28360 [Desulforhabdus amnigena]
MKKIFIIFAIFLTLFCGPSWAHEEQTPVIIDTDMALDDVRALTILLNSHHLKVKAIVTSDGASSPAVGCKNLQRILRFLGKEDIPLGAGRVLNASSPPPWREISEAMGWAALPAGPHSDDMPSPPAAESGSAVRPEIAGTASGKPSCPTAVSTVQKVLSQADEGMGYICIGPLTNLADLLREDPGVAERIKNIFFYGSLPNESNPDWNVQRDMESAKVVLASGIPFYAFRLSNEELLTFDGSMLSEIQKLDSPASRLVCLLHQNERTQKLLKEAHFKAWDESVALYLDEPGIGTFEKVEGQSPLFRLSKWDKESAYSHYLEVLGRSSAGKLEERLPVVLQSYPTQPSRFQEDLRPWVPKIIALHGIEEWKATVLTNELHRHLGIYSILGAKMGIQAREILNASLDELTVESHAGLKPPLSCLNDGLQVSTGASLGRGTIRVTESDPPTVEADFSKGDRKLRLRLKESVKERIKSDIQGAIQRHGNLTPEYFKEVRRLSFEYWLHMKRGEIFDLEWNSP